MARKRRQKVKCVDCGVELTTQDALAGQIVQDDEGLHHAECAEPDAMMIQWKVGGGRRVGRTHQAHRYADALGLIEVAPGIFAADDKSLADSDRMEREDLDTPLDPDRRV